MTPEDKQFLDTNREHNDTLEKAGYLRGLSGETRQTMQDVIRRNWEPTYYTDLWCPPCVCDMLRKLYRHYDEWLKQNANDGNQQ